MIILDLFLTFLQIGAVSFGGGYAMIPLIQDMCVSKGWLLEEELMNFIAVSESTPGPFAINLSTFVGSSQAGILGSAMATLGMVLPSFVIILIVVALLKNLMKYKGVQAFLTGVRPVVVGLIIATAIKLFLNVICGISVIKDGINFDIFAIIIFAVTAVFSALSKKFRNTAPSAILLIIIAAILGIIFYM